MDPIRNVIKYNRRAGWRFEGKILLVIVYISLFVLQINCQTISNGSGDSKTKPDVSLDSNVAPNHCHSCHSSNKFNSIVKELNEGEDDNHRVEHFMKNVIVTLKAIVNKTEDELEKTLDDALSKDKFEIIEGVEIKTVQVEGNARQPSETQGSEDKEEGRALFSKYTYEYRLLQKVKNFVDTHILSINLPKAFRSFGLKKFFLPLLIGAQVFKSIILAMFLPSILGSFGKIIGKGLSQLSASSSQASFPPTPMDDQGGYSNDNKDFMGYETSPTGTYAYVQDNMYDANENDLSNVDMSRFGIGGQKVSYLPTKNDYYKNQMTGNNNYKVFQKIPASSMILSNYDPFYSPLLSRLDGIFARLGLAPSETSADAPQVGGQTLSDVKLESCREELICLMYSSPAKYAPYSNLVSAQLSRELNELRRPVSDNPEILRFFRYMRAARRGQEGGSCAGPHAACARAAPAHTMIAAYHDINKLVSARKLHN